MKPTTSSKRNIQIDLLKLLSIYSVFLGHTYLHSGYNWHDAFFIPINAIIYSVHMPLFMFISGFFVKNTFDKKKYLNRVLDLLIPFISMDIISLVLNRYWGISPHCWFFMCLIICYSIYMLICYMREKLKFGNMTYIVILTITCLLFSNIIDYKVGYLLPFYLLGKLFYTYFELVKRYKKQVIMVSLLGYIVFFLFLYKPNYTSDLFHSKWLSLHYIDIYCLYAYIVRFLTALLGCVFISTVFISIKSNPVAEKISIYGTYTMQLYYFCIFFCQINPPLYQTFGILYQPICFIVSAIEMAGCIIVVLLISKMNYLNMILFNKGEKKVKI